MILLPCAIAQEIVIVTTRSFGSGPNEAAAVKNAVVEAIGRVSGEQITARSVAETGSRESSAGASEFKANYDQRIDSLIRGVVKSSRTLSVGRDPVSNLYKAEVEVGVATFKHSEQLERIKLAIILGAQGLPSSLGSDPASFVQALINGASDKLVTAQKFAVLDRQQRDLAQTEFRRITSGRAAIENNVRLQSAAIADFLVVLEVSEYVLGRSVQGSERATAAARAMVYDYTSGQIRQTINARATRLLRAGSNLGLAEQLGAELAEKIIENVFPARIIATESGNAIINAGFGQFDVGDLVEVRRQGQALRDPYTQESLGVSETPVSQGVIRMVMPKTAVVQITSGERLGDLGTSNYVIRRRLGPDTPTGAGEPSQSLLKKGKKNDDDW